MKTSLHVLAATVFIAFAPSRCLALWEIETVSKERAKELGMEVRSSADGPNQMRVELEFKLEGELKNFSRVELSLGGRNNPVLTAPLQVDRSRPGRIIVGLSAGAAQVDKLTLSVMVPGGLGGSIYELKVKDFVERDRAKPGAARAEDERAIAREAAQLGMFEEVESLEAQREVRLARLKAAQVAVKIAEVHAATLARGVATEMEVEKARLEVEAAKARYEIHIAEVKEIDVKIKYAKKRLEMAK